MRVAGPWLVFGAYWGVWGASVPAVRDQAGVSPAQLGTALLFIGLGALPAMAGTGRLVDRWGTRVAGPLIALLGLSGLVTALTARDLAGLAGGLLVLGATSGAADVAINALSAEAERASGRPVIARSHALFSAAVVAGSALAGGAAFARAPVALPFAAVLAGGAVVGAVTFRGGAAPDESRDRGAGTGVGRLPFLPLLVIGLISALAFAVENAHQSWSAVFLTDVLHAGTGLSAAAPAVFAAVASTARFALGDRGSRHPAAVLLLGGACAVAGTALVATSGRLAVALAGLAVAAAGTAVLYPTLIAAALAPVPDAWRGRATSRVATTAYLGFLAGPVIVGRIASAASLRTALLAVAALAAAFTLLAAPAARGVRAHAPAPGSPLGGRR